MTVVREVRDVVRRESEAVDDRAALLSVLSQELVVRLGRHPLPPRAVMPMARPPSRWRWVALGGFVAVIGAGAAAVAALHGTLWQPLERKGGPLKAAEEVAAVPLPPIVPAAAQAALPPADIPAVPRIEPPAVQAPQIQEQAPAAAEAPTIAAAPAAPEAPSAERELTATEVFELQSRLQALQFDPGPLDGLRGPLTRAAVRRFQESRGQRVTGEINLGILVQLRQSSVSPE